MTSSYSAIPPEIRFSLDEYANRGTPVGSFLRAVLANNLLGAVCLADPDSLTELKQICQYVHNELPSGCHGSPQIVKDWIAKFSARGGA